MKMKFAKYVTADNETRFCRVRRTGRKNTRVVWLVTGEDYLVPTPSLTIISAEEAGVVFDEPAAIELPPTQDETLSGEEITRLMTGNQITIKRLAERLGITPEQVRDARRDGVDGVLLVHEWKQAIMSTTDAQSCEEAVA
jgi:hypothetical protein